MATSNPYGSGRFKLNVNRVKSKKWTNADKVDYGGGWGDDDSDDGYDEPAPVSADNPRHPAWNVPPNAYPSNRSVTNPSPSRSSQRPSFDRGDERRHFSSAGNFDSPYPTTQRSPFAEVQPDLEPAGPNYGVHPALRLNTQDPGPMPQSGFPPGPRGRPYPPYEDVPMSAPGGYPQQRRSGSSNRPGVDPFPHYEIPMRPDSRSSQASQRQFPPRKQSLTQPTAPTDLIQGGHSPAVSHASGTAVPASAPDDRPAPTFIRPSDIYKRMNEEMEKARKSQESSRPSTATEPSRVRDGSVGARSTTSDSKETATGAQPLSVDDTESARRLKPTLDPVPERKSEYGFENLVNAPKSHVVQQPKESPSPENNFLGLSKQETDASSIYTDRPDPVSASSLSRNDSAEGDLPQNNSPVTKRPNFALPPISRLSGFGMDTGLSDTTASQDAPLMPRSPVHEPPQIPAKDVVPNTKEESDVKGLGRQPMMAYNSVVQQVFDQSEHRHMPLTHSSTSSTIDRSNSDSTANISPILSRKPDSARPPAMNPVPQPTIPEESAQSDSRLISSSTLKSGASAAPADIVFAPPLGYRPGYRRDITPPSRDNSPAKKPSESKSSMLVEPQHGSVIDEDTTKEDQIRGRTPSLKDKPLPAQPKPEVSTSDPGAPLTMLRTESPPKGTVRELAGKLESSSGRSSPTNSAAQVPLPGLGQSRPPPQARFDSFRPAIPGGWQSYTSSGPGTPGISTSSLPSTRPQFAPIRSESSESIPTARAPAGPAPQEQGVTQMAFAAVASAGTALVDAFGGHGAAPSDHDSSHPSSTVESENEWDQSSADDEGGAEHSRAPGRVHEAVAERSAPIPLALLPGTGVPRPGATAHQSQSLAASTPLSSAVSSEEDVPHSTLDYLPAPLRTRHSIDPSSVRPPIPTVSKDVEESPPVTENERLQQEIVKSLTPKSSHLADEGNQVGVSPDPASTSTPATREGAAPQSLALPLAIGAIGAGIVHHDSQTRLSAEERSLPPAALISPAMPPPTSGASHSTQIGLPSNVSPHAPKPSTPLQPLMAQTSSPDPDPGLDAAVFGAKQPQQPGAQDVSTSARPFLKQRFSWETGSSPPASVTTPNQTSSPPTSSPDTIRAPSQAGPTVTATRLPMAEFQQPVNEPAAFSSQRPVQIPASTTSKAPLPSPPATLSQQSPLPASPPLSDTSPPRDSRPQKGSPAPMTLNTQSDDPPAFRSILSLGSPVDRIKAFDESRQFYAAPNDQLQSWLLSMRTPENSQLFAANGFLSSDTSEVSSFNKPSPRRMMTDSAGARQMQEDGKKMMAAAGRFGGKAGNAAKGLFAKGKEKMRNASSGEKGILASRRRSSGAPLDEPEEAPPPAQPRESAFLGPAPQIPFDITPASPLATPTEWFSNHDFASSQTSGLDSVLQQGAKAPSTTTAEYETSRSTAEDEKDTPRGSVAPAAGVGAAPVLNASPAISALDSDLEQPEDNGVPSRSISQLTKPTDQSAATSPNIANLERNKSQRDSQTITHRDIPISNLAPPPPITDRHEGSGSDAESSDRSLRVPEARRRSIISDVSSASPSPGPDADGQDFRRSVSLSPADEAPMASITGMRREQTGQPTQAVPSAMKLHASADRDAVTNLPSLDQHPSVLRPGGARSKSPFEEPESRRAVEPEAQQINQRREETGETHDPNRYRPFSFVSIGGEGTNLHTQPEHEQDHRRILDPPMSPISQTRSSAAFSKDMSQVSVDEVADQDNALPRRHSRSYSRPFGVDPHVRNHPALRTGEAEEPPVDRARMYSSESPLPSARRAQEELQQALQQREQQRPSIPPQPQPQPQPHKEGYRIPGPYVQEYRSPKPVSSPKNGRSQAQVQASGQPLPSTFRSQGYDGRVSPQPEPEQNSYFTGDETQITRYQDPGNPFASTNANANANANTYSEYDMKPEDYEVYSKSGPAQQQRQSMGPPPHPNQQQQQQMPTSFEPAVAAQPPAPQPQAQRKRSTFGKLFGGGAAKGTKLQKPDRATTSVDNLESQNRDKRGSMLRRIESVSSRQSSQRGAEDQLGQLPPATPMSHSARRQSRDILRAPTPEISDKPTESKKKRFSGLGGKLFKSSSTAKLAPSPITTAQGPLSEQQRNSQRVMSPGPYSPQPSGVMSPEPQSAQTPYGQYPAGPGSYFNQGQTQSPYPLSAYPQGQSQAHPAQYAAVPASYQQQSRPGSYGYPPQSPPSHGQAQPGGPSAQSGYMYPTQNRPADLRIDTTHQHRNQHGPQGPATAPAQVQPASSTSAPYNPNPSPSGATSAPVMSNSSPLPQSSNPRAHVINLHKRSRSPRLGRTLSDDLDASQQQPQQQQPPKSMLGTFSSKKMSPVGGIRRSENDQERPYAITVPGLDDDERNRRNKRLLPDRSGTPVSIQESGGGAATSQGNPRSPVHTGTGHLERNVSVLDGYNNVPTSPREARRSSARDKTTPAGVIAELPGSKAEGYESEEEIPMSATAYPGQEWMPVFVGDGRWDD